MHDAVYDFLAAPREFSALGLGDPLPRMEKQASGFPSPWTRSAPPTRECVSLNAYFMALGADFAEAVDAFIEKRKPIFIGK